MVRQSVKKGVNFTPGLDLFNYTREIQEELWKNEVKYQKSRV